MQVRNALIDRGWESERILRLEEEQGEAGSRNEVKHVIDREGGNKGLEEVGRKEIM